MVDIEITPSDLGLVVRFKRQAWSRLLDRHYMQTDLIIVVRAEWEDDLRADFEIYRGLDEQMQLQFIDQLKMIRYEGRRLSSADIQKTEYQDPALPQMFLF